MKFLIDECLHMSLVATAASCGHEATHINWLGLSGEADWDLMPRILEGDFTFVTNNAVDFRKLYAKERLHAGLVIILPQLTPTRQREAFNLLLGKFTPNEMIVNEVVEIIAVSEDARDIDFRRYDLPRARLDRPTGG